MSTKRYKIPSEDSELVDCEWVMLGSAGALAPYWAKITACLNYWLGDVFHGPNRFVPAALLCNPYGHCQSPWRLGLTPQENDKGYGKRDYKDALDNLKRDKKALVKLSKGKTFGGMSGQECRLKIEDRIYLHIGPFRGESRKLNNLTDEELLSLICDQMDALSEKLRSLEDRRGKIRAENVAIGLRAVFEAYSSKPVSSSSFGDGRPSGAFSSCLEDLFDILEIEGDFRHYASKAVNPKKPLMLLLREMKESLIATEHALALSQKSLSFTESW